MIPTDIRDGDRTAQQWAQLPIAPVRHPWQWLATAIVLATLGVLVASLATNQNMAWDVVADYLFVHDVLVGVRWTIILAFAAIALATVVGVVVAIMRTSNSPLLVAVAAGYLWIFRSVPPLVQLIFWFNLALVFPLLGPAILFGENGGGIDTNEVMTWFVAGLLGLGLAESAYMSEIVRGGLLAVDPGQSEAAESLGMTRGQILRRIVLPQALRIIVPPWMNQFVSVLKATSLVAFVAGLDLLSSVQHIYAVNYRVVPLLIVASLWYLVLVSLATIGQHFVEKRLNQGYERLAETTGVQS